MIKRRPRAIYSIIDLAEYMGRTSPSSAERFFDAIEETFRQLETMPGIGHRYESDDPRLQGYEFGRFKGFLNTWFSTGR